MSQSSRLATLACYDGGMPDALHHVAGRLATAPISATAARRRASW